MRDTECHGSDIGKLVKTGCGVVAVQWIPEDAVYTVHRGRINEHLVVAASRTSYIA